jgi:hypothetical protein
VTYQVEVGTRRAFVKSGNDFYGMAANVIPLLFVAMAFDLRPRAGEAHGPVRQILVLVIAAGMALGEASAIYGIAHDVPIAFGPGELSFFVLGGLLVGGAGVIGNVRI